MDLPNLILVLTEAVIEHGTEVGDVAQAAVEHGAESGGIIGTLGINGKLFIAQLINFAVVLFVLWKWVFKPVGGALEKRRLKIEESIKKAEAVEERVKAFEIEREEKLIKARKEAEAIVHKASQTADAVKNDIMEKARVEADGIAAKARKQIESEKQQALADVRAELGELTASAAEKIIRIKLNHQNDKEIIEQAIKEVSNE